jgi:hypothetical protein
VKGFVLQTSLRSKFRRLAYASFKVLDRDVRKPHENPDSGFCCALAKLTKSSSTYSIAEYQTQLPDEQPLQAKLHEFYSLNVDEI